MKTVKLIALVATAIALPSAASAACTAFNTSFSTFSCTVNNNNHTINITEVWGGSLSQAFVKIDGLDSNAYQVTKTITNNTGTSWISFANELLDPAGQANDRLDPQPYPGFVPMGYTTSNDNDGLSFNQGGGSTRSSSAFSQNAADEFTDARDFLDFFNGSVANGTTFTVTYGIIDTGNNEPFLLAQRANVRSVGAVPEPATWGMMLVGFGGIGAAMRRRTRTRVTFA